MDRETAADEDAATRIIFRGDYPHKYPGRSQYLKVWGVGGRLPECSLGGEGGRREGGGRKWVWVGWVWLREGGRCPGSSDKGEDG